MTVREYARSLADQNLSQTEMYDKIRAYSNSLNPIKEEKEEKEEEVKKEDSKTADPSSESSDDIGSELASGPSQQVDNSGRTPEQQAQYEKITAVAKPEEVITKNGFDFKYDNTGQYYYKPEGSDNGSWKTYEDKQSVANLSIASQFGHSDFNLDEYNKTKDTLKKGEELYIGIDGGLKIGEANEITLNSNALELEKQFLEDTALTTEDENRIQIDTNAWFEKSTIPETKTKKRSAKLGGDVEVETGNMIPNPEWVQAEIESKKAWNAMFSKGLSREKPSGEPQLSEDGLTEQEWIQQNMKSNYANSLKAEAEKEKLETWIESQEGGFDWKKAILLFSGGPGS